MAKKGSSVDTSYYAIEKILGSRKNADAQLEYLIKWKDSKLPDTWELVDNLFATKMTKMQALSNENSSQNGEMQTEHWNDETPLDPEASREISQEQPKPKRRRNDESQSMSTSISGSEIPMRSDKITQKTENQNREVESVEHLRKRKNKHEYLVKWKDADKKQWIERDIMIAEHPQSVIAYLQTLIDFR